MKIANAPCSWGVLEFDLEGNTESENIPYVTVLNEMVQTGYVGTELGDWGFFPTDPITLMEELEPRELNLVGAFVPVRFLDRNRFREGVEIALKSADLLKSVDGANARIVLSDDNGSESVRTRYAGRIRQDHTLSWNEWTLYAARVEELAQIVREETGVVTVFHHHCGGFVETPQEIETLLSLTDPSLIGLCFDTGHFAFGGGDPVEGLKRYASRIGHVHFKDFDRKVYKEILREGLDYFGAVERGIFCELGKGSIDFIAVLEQLRQMNYRGWIVVEQDILPGMGTPKESALHNRNYLRSIGI